MEHKVQPSKENTMYMLVRAVEFYQIIDGVKKEISRDIKKGIRAGWYLDKDENGAYLKNPEVTEPDKEYHLDDYNDGNFPFLPKLSKKFIHFSTNIGKDRDEAFVELKGFSFKPDNIRKECHASWSIVLSLGNVIEHSKKAE